MAARMILRKATAAPAVFNRRTSVVVRASEQPPKAPVAAEQVVESVSVPAAETVPTPAVAAVTTNNKTVSFGGERPAPPEPSGSISGIEYPCSDSHATVCSHIRGFKRQFPM